MGSVRLRAIGSLIASRAAGTGGRLLIELLDDSELQGKAIRGLASFNEPNTSEELLKRFTQFGDSAKQDALQTLASKREWAAALLDAVESQAIDRKS